MNYESAFFQVKSWGWVVLITSLLAFGFSILLEYLKAFCKSVLHITDDPFQDNVNHRIKEVLAERCKTQARCYFCIGCRKEMIAVVNFKDPSHKQYYRHDVVNEHEAKCTYSDETTRHKIAKEILQQLKEIKVPAIYSYPPSDTFRFPFTTR